MRYQVTITGDDADDIVAYLREVGAEKEVDIVDTSEPSVNPLDDIVYYMDRINTNLMRTTSYTRHLRSIDNKMLRIASALERIADATDRSARIEQDRRDEEVLNLRK